MSVEILGGAEVPTELLGHALSFLADDPTSWVRSTMAVSRAWRAVTLQLLRAHAAEVVSALPPPCPDFAYTPHEEQERAKEGNVLYAWRHDDKRAPTPVSETCDEEDDGEWWLAYVNYQLVAVSEVGALPHVDGDSNESEESTDGYSHSQSSEAAFSAARLWSVKPWADIFRRFISHDCPRHTFDAATGPVAALIWLLVLASDARRIVVLSSRRSEGHPFTQSGHDDVQLFFSLRHSAVDWLPWWRESSSLHTEPRSRFVRVHLRDTLHNG